MVTTNASSMTYLITPAETANTISSLALGVAAAALLVSIFAAGFTGWQAVTMHLERTRPRPAALVLPPAEPGKPRTIKNEGGSAAHSVQVFVWGTPTNRRMRRGAYRIVNSNPPAEPAKYRFPGEPVTAGQVRGSIPAGETVVIEGYGPRKEIFDPPKGIPGVASHLEILYGPALAFWTDSRGKRRHAWIEIR